MMSRSEQKDKAGLFWKPLRTKARKK
jgi:hypothetical protein